MEKIKKQYNKLKKWHLIIKIIPILIVITILKIIFIKSGFEILTLNALFTSLIAGTIFLIGFLITGVISDYKESEKLPSDMAVSLETLYDEIYIINKNKNSKLTEDFLKFYSEFLVSVPIWFYKKEKTQNMLEKLHKMDDYFADLEPIMQANFLSRMKNEQSNLRKIIIRINTIRDTNFVESAYAILETLAFFLIMGLLILKIGTFYESLFFTILVSFLIIYMIMLIHDLDNPFEYTKKGEAEGTVVSIKPILDLKDRIIKNMK